MRDQIEFLSRAQDEVDPFDLSDFFGLELGVAADDHDKGVRIALHCSPDGVSTFGIRMVSDTAGVDDHDIRGIVQMHSCIPRLSQLACQRGCLTEIQFATKRMKRSFQT